MGGVRKVEEEGAEHHGAHEAGENKAEGEGGCRGGLGG